MKGLDWWLVVFLSVFTSEARRQIQPKLQAGSSGAYRRVCIKALCVKHKLSSNFFTTNTSIHAHFIIAHLHHKLNSTICFREVLITVTVINIKTDSRFS